MSFKHFGSYQEPTKHIRIPSGVRIEGQRTPVLHHHFAEGAGALNSWVPQPFVTTEAGTGTPWAPNATAGSNIVGVTGATTNNAEELAGKKVGWNPSTQGGIFLEVRAKFSSTGNAGDICIGFSDAVTETSSLAYVVSAASALTTHAPTDHASFYNSSIATSGALASLAWGFITSKADVDTVTAASSAKTKDTSFHVFRLEITASGDAIYFYDDEHIGTVATAVTANIEYTPYVAIIAKNSVALTGTIDYVTVGAGTYV